MSETRIRFEYDEDPDYSYLAETPESYAENPAMVTDYGKAPREIPFDEYRETWGNPDLHTSLVAFAEAKCRCCGSWVMTDSLSGIDFYTGPTSGPIDYPNTGIFESPADLPEGSYQRELFEDMTFALPLPSPELTGK